MKKTSLLGVAVVILSLFVCKPVLAWHPPIVGDIQPPVISTVYSSSLLLSNGGYLRLAVKATDNNYIVGIVYMIDGTPVNNPIDTYRCFAYFNKCETMFGPFSDTSTHRYDIVAYDQNGNATPMWWGKFRVSTSTFVNAYERDQKRIVDLNLIKDGLAGYLQDYGTYPVGTALNLGDNFLATTLGGQGWSLVGQASPVYLNKVPSDPISPARHYVYTKVGVSYSVTAKLDGSINGLSGNIILTPSGIKQN